MQLTELTLIIAEEAALCRDSLLAGAIALTTLESNEANQPLLDEAAFTYADFCARSSQATESLGLSGLAWVASSLAHIDRKSTRLNSSHVVTSRMPSSA